MAKKRTKRGLDIRLFILKNVSEHSDDVIRVACERFDLTRQAVSRYVRELVDEGLLEAEGATRARRYSLAILGAKTRTFDLHGLAEDAAWRSGVRDELQTLSGNVVDVWHYGFTEIVNNAIDHSGGDTLVVTTTRTGVDTRMTIADDGVGIFRKISKQFNLEDERHAVLELSKGKLTTDPERHTGEGIFFTSRMFDDFAILSGGVYFSHAYGEIENWIMEHDSPVQGTAVFMGIANDADRRPSDVFEKFATEDEDYGFNRTVVPVRMARHGAEKLISRSQAKRLLARVDRFNTVLFDFAEVDHAGRAFIDEIFRVFVRTHPNVVVQAINTSHELEKMIAKARSETGGAGT